MGADIHIWYERREGDGWVSVEDPPVEQSDEWPKPMDGHFVADGRELSVASVKDWQFMVSLIAKGVMLEQELENYAFVKSKEERAERAVRVIVDTYHIDTEVGLRLFADTVQRLIASRYQKEE